MWRAEGREGPGSAKGSQGGLGYGGVRGVRERVSEWMDMGAGDVHVSLGL